MAAGADVTYTTAATRTPEAEREAAARVVLARVSGPAEQTELLAMLDLPDPRQAAYRSLAAAIAGRDDERTEGSR